VIRAIILAAGLGLATAALATSPALSVKAEMKQIVEPASNTLFAVGGEVDPANGPGQPRTADARWKEAVEAAAALKGVASDLQTPTLARDAGAWKDVARQMAASSAAAETAARAKDAAGLAAAANALSDSCSGCHARYKPQTAG
jgi:cytochrome c556